MELTEMCFRTVSLEFWILNKCFSILLFVLLFPLLPVFFIINDFWKRLTCWSPFLWRRFPYRNNCHQLKLWWAFQDRIDLIFLVQDLSKPDASKAEFAAGKQHILNWSPDCLNIFCPVIGSFIIQKDGNKPGSACYYTCIMGAFRELQNSLPVLDNNKTPGLIIQPWRSPSACVENYINIFLADRFVRKLPDAPPV